MQQHRVGCRQLELQRGRVDDLDGLDRADQCRRGGRSTPEPLLEVGLGHIGVEVLAVTERDVVAELQFEQRVGVVDVLPRRRQHRHDLAVGGHAHQRVVHGLQVLQEVADLRLVRVERLAVDERGDANRSARLDGLRRRIGSGVDAAAPWTPSDVAARPSRRATAARRM